MPLARCISRFAAEIKTIFHQAHLGLRHPFGSHLFSQRSIFNLYAVKGLNIQTFDKTYLVSFQDRNNRESEHLMITNYEQEPNLVPPPK
jgi:hypothetical protein